MSEVFFVFADLITQCICLMVSIMLALGKPQLFQEPETFYFIQLSSLAQKLCLFLFTKVRYGNFQIPAGI